MNATLIAFATILAAALLWVILGYVVLRRFGMPTAKVALEAYWSERWKEIDDRLSALENDVGSLPRVWEEFAKDAKKSQERARWHVRRVKKELEERGLSDGELDSLDSEIRTRDGERGNGQGLLPLHDAMAEIPASPPEDPITQVLRRKWGSQ